MLGRISFSAQKCLNQQQLASCPPLPAVCAAVDALMPSFAAARSAPLTTCCSSVAQHAAGSTGLPLAPRAAPACHGSKGGAHEGTLVFWPLGVRAPHSFLLALAPHPPQHRLP